MAYIYFAVALLLSIFSFSLYRHQHHTVLRALGILLGYIAGAIALKVFLMIAP
ncbi:MAG: hypothetical protein WAN36_09360 [Calditrichia bacterium]